MAVGERRLANFRVQAAKCTMEGIACSMAFARNSILPMAGRTLKSETVSTTVCRSQPSFPRVRLIIKSDGRSSDLLSHRRLPGRPTSGMVIVDALLYEFHSSGTVRDFHPIPF